MPERISQTDQHKSDFEQLRNPITGRERILKKLARYEANIEQYLQPWIELSQETTDNHNLIYPNQGLLHTPYDYISPHNHEMLDQEQVVETLRARFFFLELSNHPYRVNALLEVENRPFEAPPKINSPLFASALQNGLSLAIGDLAASSLGGENDRVSRSERYANGPFVKLGKHARTPFVGSESPDIWNSTIAVATMAASHCIATIPRNGLLSDIRRQADFAQDVFYQLELLADMLLDGREDKNELLAMWKRNVVAAVEPTAEKAMKRSASLLESGVRGFRIYSPEPGNAIIESTRLLRHELGEDVEIFTGQVVDVQQAKKVNDAGADMIITGLAGGGRCITGPRSGTAVDWPELVWDLRGEIDIPVTVQGGASDHVAVTLLLGASGIGVSRIVGGGTIESPGGILYCVDNTGNKTRPYAGEAAARNKFLDGKLLPFDIPSFVEGETTTAEIGYIRHLYPTLTHNLHYLLEEGILSLVFRGVKDINELHKIDPSPIRRITAAGDFQRNTH